MWYGNNNNKVTGDCNHGCLELSDNVTILQNLMVNKIVSTVDVSYKGQVKKLGLLAVAGKGPSLLGAQLAKSATVRLEPGKLCPSINSTGL